MFLSKYKDDAPAKLAAWEVFLAFVRRALGYVPLAIRGLFIAAVWVGFVPFVTNLIHSLAFCRGLRDAWNMVKFFDWGTGSLMVSWICGVFVMLMVMVGAGLLSLLQDLMQRVYGRLMGPGQRLWGRARPAHRIHMNNNALVVPALDEHAPEAARGDVGAVDAGPAPVLLVIPDDEVTFLLTVCPLTEHPA